MIDQISPGQLADWLQTMRAHGEPVVLDVREPHELALASVTPEGYTVVAIPMGIIPLRLQELDPAQPVACLCHHGARSMQVAYFLQSHGFIRVANIAGGIHAWSVELDPSVPQY